VKRCKGKTAGVVVKSHTLAKKCKELSDLMRELPPELSSDKQIDALTKKYFQLNDRVNSLVEKAERLDEGLVQADKALEALTNGDKTALKVINGAMIVLDLGVGAIDCSGWEGVVEVLAVKGAELALERATK
jgi:uncharacterized protein YlxW (UPF0749 family)